MKMGYLSIYLHHCVLINIHVKVLTEYLAKITVLVCKGYHKRKDQYHRLGGLNNKNLFSHSPKAINPRSRCLQVWFLLRLLSFACRWWLPTVSSQGLSLRGTDPQSLFFLHLQTSYFFFFFFLATLMACVSSSVKDWTQTTEMTRLNSQLLGHQGTPQTSFLYKDLSQIGLANPF